MTTTTGAKATTTCRDCDTQVSFAALTCPSCGAPRPFDAEFTGYGYEWKSEQEFLGLPLVHVSFKYRPNRLPVVARGWLAIGQFSAGFVNVSQFGVGPFCLSQIALAGVAVSQVTASVYALCQAGFVYDGFGQALMRWKDFL